MPYAWTRRKWFSLLLSVFNTSIDFSPMSVIINKYLKTLMVSRRHVEEWLRTVSEEARHGDTTGGVEDLHEGGLTAAGAAERSSMWLLVIVLLNIVPGLNKVTVLNTFATAEECQIERNRIGFEMAAAYPNERDFVIACQLNPKHSS
jgi:hypothetical protein